MANRTGNDAGDRDGAEGASGAERLTGPHDDRSAARLPFPVVGIGASAGGLEAYTEFLQAAPPDAGIAYVLIQHLPPDRESLLVELLARKTAMPVLEVTDGLAVLADHVYVIRPGNTLTIKGGHLRLGPQLAARGHGRPVDDFFRSLAEEQQQRAVAIVFSGMGSNGSAGAQAVKAVGGLVIAQEPESARYPAMPRSLIDAHLADLILRPAEVAEALVKYARQPYTVDDGATPTTPREEQVLADVLAVLRTRTRHEFSGYRKPTLLRRVRRRMGLGQVASMTEYVRILRQTPAEVTALADDLLIHVTGFFRDPKAWAVLQEKALDPLVVERPDRAEIRCWVAACATGEEAYTLAMLLIETAEAHGKRFDIKVFATDMAERALGSARTGMFPNGIESEVTPERLARFFERDDNFYRVKKALREVVVFAPQNILQDPPFSRLDIITCRNLLIYLEPETQRRVLALLHFGLREGGILLLGSSESAASLEGDFEPLDKRHRVFRRVGPTRSGTLDLPVLTAATRDARQAGLPASARPPVQTVAQLAGRALLDRCTPPAVVVDATGQVVHVHGDTSRYLSLRAGVVSFSLLDLANDQVRGTVRTVLRRTLDELAAVTLRDGLIDTLDGRRRVEVGSIPLGTNGGPPLYLVTFNDYPEPVLPPIASDGDATAREGLADELQRVRNELQGALEEMQSSNEELKASHEEATSLNEELQSTNEELETSKEEMQSLNEELVTVNAQLQAKMSELEATANDLGSLLTSTDIAVLFLDPHFRIRRFTPAVKDLLDLIPSDVGRPFLDLRRKFVDPELLTDAQSVLDRLIPIEREIESESGRIYLRRVLPYRTQDNRIDGALVAFFDITRPRADELARRDAEERYLALFNAIDQGFCTIEVAFDASDRPTDYRFLEVSPAFEQQSGVKNAAGRWMREVAPDQDEFWFTTYGRVARTGVPETFENYSTPLGRWWHVYAFRIRDPQLRQLGVLFTDITERKRREERQGFLLRLSDALRPLADAGAIEREATRLLGEQLAVSRVFYSAVEADGDTGVVRSDHVAGIPSGVGRYSLSAFAPELMPDWRAGRTTRTTDVTTDPRFNAAQRAAFASLSARATVGVPLVKAGRLVGVFALNHSSPREWTADEISLIEETAERTWAAVERANAEASLRDSEARQAFLLQLSDTLRPLADPSAVQQAAMSALGRRLKVERAMYFTVGGDAESLTVGPVHLDGAAPTPPVLRIADLGAPVADVLRRGETLVLADLDSDDRFGPAAREALAALQIRALLAAPLRKGDPLVALVVVQQSGPRAWTSADLTLLGEVAERTWAAVERARAALVLRASEERQAYLLKLSDALRPLGDAVAIEVEATRVLGEHLGVERALYAEVEADQDHIVVHRDYTAPGMPSFAGRMRVSDFGEFWAEGYRAGRTLSTADVRGIDGAQQPAFAAAGIVACLGVPVHKLGRLVGILVVHAASPRAWTPLEVALIEATAERTWAAVERAGAEAALRASEARLRSVAANLPNGAAFVVDRDLRYTLAEGQALVAVGFSSADFEGKTLAEALPVALAEQHLPYYRQALAGAPFRVEHAAHGRQFVTHGEPLRGAAGQVTGVLAVSYDISDLRQVEERLRLALAAARMGIWTLDVASGTHTRDANLNQLLGLEPVETRRPFADFLAHVHPDDRASVAAAFADSLRLGQPLNLEFRVVRPDGEVRWLRDQGDVFGDAAAGRRHMAGACVDVSERRAAEDAVRAGDERLREILDSATDYAIVTLADDRTVTSWSSGAAAIFGYAAAEIVGRSADQLFTPEDQAAGAPRYEVESARRNGRAEDERWHLRKDGSRFYASGVLTPLATGDFVKVARDLTERKRMEDQLRDARDRLEERVSTRTAELAAAVASLEAEFARRRELTLRLSNAQEDERKRVSRDLHDSVGQLHAALIMALATAAQSVPAGTDVAGQLAYAVQLAEGVGRELHDVAVRLRPTTLDDLGLAAALGGLVRTWSRQQGKHVELGVDLHGRLPEGVETALYRLVQEALTNVARHARAESIGVVVTEEPGMVTAIVEDDGAGFELASVDGSRLGLRGMRERLALIGGDLLIESQPGKGTSIIARVPLPEKPPA